MDTTFCLNCCCRQPYHTRQRIVENQARGIRFKYVEEKAVCSICGLETYAAEVNDRNVERIEAAYERMKRTGGKTCRTCGKYLGFGDWNLCCRIKPDLVYEDTPSCKDYEERKNERIPQD